MSKICYCHVKDHKHQKREKERYRMTARSYHEHRCECVCGCKQDTLGYGFCPHCHFEHAEMRNQKIGVLGLPFGDAPKPSWWNPKGAKS